MVSYLLPTMLSLCLIFCLHFSSATQSKMEIRMPNLRPSVVCHIIQLYFSAYSNIKLYNAIQCYFKKILIILFHFELLYSKNSFSYYCLLN